MDKNITTKPLVSVLMPVYNAEKFLHDAIESILAQTFTNFEFIIINDGSTDRSELIIQSNHDDRIKYHPNAGNLGIVATLNKGLALAQGKYIARMDADDISLPERLALQFHFMEANPLFAVCGAQAINIDEKGNHIGIIKVPETDEEIKVQLLFNNVFIHPLTFFRTETIKQYGYSQNYQYAEDYYLLTQIAEKHKLANLNETLLLYRTQENNITSTRVRQMDSCRKKIYENQLSRLLEKSPSEQFISDFFTFTNNKDVPFSKIKLVLEEILLANINTEIYNQSTLAKILHDKWFTVLRLKKTGRLLSHFFRSPLFSKKDFTMKQLRKLLKQRFCQFKTLIVYFWEE
ncbi:Glycosyl transferase family 2 [Pedobacter sp. ok626]|uniref:glycosyltransferase family 2 protein n=1 Tax=Pedobacter sp. ok626 TaxID=1761882 RepID=UPI00087E85E2|nr:glycosyltransferase [Pedobacter sp. ok626]SDK81106.1 Glycosyl transferase family 2 [Pedobacter sp. ok626]